MKRPLITLGLAMFCMVSARAEMPEGPGGRLWVCSRWPTNEAPLRLFYIDIDEDWQKVNAAPNGMTTVRTDITNSAFGFGHPAPTAVLNCRGMYSLWTNGTPLIFSYYNNSTGLVNVTWKLMGDVFAVGPDGKTTHLHDGATQGDPRQPGTQLSSWALADLNRTFGTSASEPPVLVIGGEQCQYGDSVWHDTNGDGNYAEPAAAVLLPTTTNPGLDAMLVGPDVWLRLSNLIRRIHWDGSSYSTRDYIHNGTSFGFRLGSDGMACGDVDGNGITDVFAFEQGTFNVWRLQDLNDDGDFLDAGESSVWLTGTEVQTDVPRDIDLYQTPGGQWVLFMASNITYNYGPWIKVFGVNPDGTWSGDVVRIIHGDDGKDGTPADYDASFDTVSVNKWHIMLEFAPNPPPPGATLITIR